MNKHCRAIYFRNRGIRSPHDSRFCSPGPRVLADQTAETKKQNQQKKLNSMKRQSTSKALLAGAAIAGLLSGGLTARLNAATITDHSATPTAGVLADEKKGETHDCKGKNSCKGKGGCKTGDNGCKGKNSCKGKGGCATDGSKAK